ncbi:MAG TPA: hypothetical protein VFU81_23425 [Thermomicrobiales bacterium]|nr:hypothetical protein [Thermomicrobiales bacterium]
MLSSIVIPSRSGNQPPHLRRPVETGRGSPISDNFWAQPPALGKDAVCVDLAACHLCVGSDGQNDTGGKACMIKGCQF